MLKYIKYYLASGLAYNTGLLLFTRINREDPHFIDYPHFYYKKILHVSLFRTLLFPYSLLEYGMYPKIRSLTFPPKQENLRLMYRLECLIGIEKDIMLRDCFLHLYLLEKQKIYS